MAPADGLNSRKKLAHRIPERSDESNALQREGEGTTLLLSTRAETSGGLHTEAGASG